MKTLMIYTLLILGTCPAFSQEWAPTRPDTVTLQMQVNVKEQIDEELPDSIEIAKQKEHSFKAIKKSVDHKGRKLHEIRIEIDKKEIPDSVRLYVRVYQPEPFFEIYRHGFVPGGSIKKIKGQEGFSWKNGKLRISVNDALSGKYRVEIRMIDPYRKLYILDREITL